MPLRIVALGRSATLNPASRATPAPELREQGPLPACSHSDNIVMKSLDVDFEASSPRLATLHGFTATSSFEFACSSDAAMLKAAFGTDSRHLGYHRCSRVPPQSNKTAYTTRGETASPGKSTVFKRAGFCADSGLTIIRSSLAESKSALVGASPIRRVQGTGTGLGFCGRRLRATPRPPRAAAQLQRVCGPCFLDVGFVPRASPFAAAMELLDEPKPDDADLALHHLVSRTLRSMGKSSPPGASRVASSGSSSISSGISLENVRVPTRPDDLAPEALPASQESSPLFLLAVEGVIKAAVHTRNRLAALHPSAFHVPVSGVVNAHSALQAGSGKTTLAQDLRLRAEASRRTLQLHRPFSQPLEALVLPAIGRRSRGCRHGGGAASKLQTAHTRMADGQVGLRGRTGLDRHSPRSPADEAGDAARATRFRNKGKH